MHVLVLKFNYPNSSYGVQPLHYHAIPSSLAEPLVEDEPDEPSPPTEEKEEVAGGPPPPEPTPPAPVQPQPKPPSPLKAATPLVPTSQGRPPATKASPPDGPQDRKAREFIDQAEKKLKSSQSFFGGLFG